MKFQEIEEGQFRLWDFQEFENQRELHRFRVENSRPRYYLDPTEPFEEYEGSVVRNDRMLYLEMGEVRTGDGLKFPVYDKNSSGFA